MINNNQKQRPTMDSEIDVTAHHDICTHIQNDVRSQIINAYIWVEVMLIHYIGIRLFWITSAEVHIPYCLPDLHINVITYK